MVILNQLHLNRCSGIIHKPSDLTCALEVLVSFIDRGNKLERVLGLLALSHSTITPLHQSELSANLEALTVRLLNDQVTSIHNSFVANVVLWMQWLCTCLRRLRSITNGQLDASRLTDACITWDDGIQNLLIHGPNLVPFHVYRVLGRALVKHEILEGFGSHTSAHDTLYSGEARIIPPINVIVLDEPAELALRKTCAQKVQLGEVIDYDGAEVECLLHPGIEPITIPILDCPQCVCHSFDGVDDGACEVIRWVRLELLSGPMVRDVFSTVEHWVTQTLDLVLHVELRPDAVVLVLAGKHALEQTHVLLWCVVTCLRIHTSISLVLHFFSGQVVRICLSLLNELLHIVLKHLEVV